ATTFRTAVIHEILDQIQLAAICGNASEIAVLGGALDKTISPDSLLKENDPAVAKQVAQAYKTVVVSTGEIDVITDGDQTFLCKNGHPMLANITTSGCLLTSIMGAFISVAN